jgi:hypothetical protein
MDSPVNVYDYICAVTHDDVGTDNNPLDDISEHGLFLTMDEIIEQKYPNNTEYDVSSEESEHKTKKRRVATPDEYSNDEETEQPQDEYPNNLEKIVIAKMTLFIIQKNCFK